MRVLVVDDERLALVQLERVLRQLMEITTIDVFQNPKQAVEQASELQPDVVFLDIHMPELSGIQAAELIQEICPQTDIVFVTAHDEYAIKAFELNAVDYLLKPLHKSRVEITIERLLKRRSTKPLSKESERQTQTIYCFKTLRFQSSGQLVELPKWRTAKAQELFSYLLHHRGQIVHKSTLLEHFFPEMDMKRAMTQLYTAIYQIRQCVQKMNMDITIHNSSIQEGYILDIGQVLLDIEQWEQGFDKLKGTISEYQDQALRLLGEYEGDYLQDYGYLWAEHERERLRQLWLSHARLLGAYYLECGDKQNEALQLYERIQTMDPYHEEEGLIVMMLYDELGCYDKVTLHYERLLQTIESDLGLAVPQQVAEWYKQWKEKKTGKELLL